MAQNDLVDVAGADAGVRQGPLATWTIRLSTEAPSSLPNGVWAQPTIQPVMTASFAEFWSLSSAIYHVRGLINH